MDLASTAPVDTQKNMILQSARKRAKLGGDPAPLQLAPRN